MSAKLYDYNSKSWVEVPDDQVDDAVKSGKYTFAQGVAVPAVAPDGTLKSIDSEGAHEAFSKNGFRWQTQADRNEDYSRKDSEIRRQAADTPGAAFAGGMARTISGGASDFLVPRIAAAIDPNLNVDEAKQLQSDIYEQSPTATGIGEVAGLIAPNPVSAVGKGTLAATEAAKVVSKAAPRILAGAAEGATFSLGQSVSEASLGDPKEALDNLISNVGTGALLGGALGGAFAGAEEAAPYLKSKLVKGVDRATDVVRDVIRKSAATGTKAVLSAAGEREAAAISKDLMTNPTFLELVRTGNVKEAEAFAKEATVAQREFEAQTKKAEKELASKFSSMPKQVQQEVSSGLEGANGDMREAIQDLHARTKFADDEFTHAMSDPKYAAEPPAKLQELEDRVQDFITELSNKPGKGTRPATKELKDALVSKFAGRQNLTLSDELLAYRDFRNIARQMEGKKGVGDLAKAFRSDIDDMILSYPDQEISHLYNRVIRPQDAMDALHATVSSSIKDPNFSKLGGILASPEKFEAIRPMLENLSEFAPEIEKFRKTATTYQARQELLEAARDKISQSIEKSVNGKVSLDDMEEVFKLLSPGRGDLASKFDEIRKASSILKSTQDMDPFSAAILFQKAMGKDISSMEKLLPLKDKMAAYQRLQDLNVQAPVGRTAATYVGGKLMGPFGAAAGNAITTALTPVKAIKSLATIDNLASKGAALFNKAADRVVDSLISSRTQRFVTVAKQSTPKERRQQFDKLAQVLPKMQDPDFMTNSLADSTAGVTSMPAFKLEMQAKLATAAQFLQSKMPQDPFAPTSPFGKSKWEPSNQELETFMRYANAVNKPLEVVDRMAEGSVTPEEVEALKVVHPELYSRLQRRVMDGILDHGEDIPYESKLVLGQMFDLPTDYTLQPDFIAAMQDMFAENDQGLQSEQQTKRPTSKLKLNPMESVATEATKVSEGQYGES